MTQKIQLSGNSDCCSEECCSPDTSPKKELKEKIKERYSKIAVSGNSESCCMPECCTDSSPKQALDCCQSAMIKMNSNQFLSHPY
jgi:hypothetical protein